MKHIKMLPPDGKENRPRRIDYVEQYNRYADFAKERSAGLPPRIDDNEVPMLDDNAYQSVLSTDWHPFYDARGVKFYHNFATGEVMRQSPRRVPNTDDAGAEPEEPTFQDVARGLAETSESLDPGATGGFMSGMAGTIPEQTGMSATAGSFGATGASFRQTGPTQLTGFDSLKSEVPAAVMAAADPENRAVRAPHRVHNKFELPLE